MDEVKCILITGESSYIGTAFEKVIKESTDMYEVDTIEVRTNKWKTIDFSIYEVIVHVAAIVHVKEKKKTKYYEVNTKLPFEIAEKAKMENVKHFIFLSTMGVYGIEIGQIDINSKPNPKSLYEISKYEAEKKLETLQSSAFTISILRPPLVYGKECVGNYRRLSRVIQRLPIFPRVNNVRSMIFVNNLAMFIKIIVDFKLGGIYYPQNEEYVNTTDLANLISNVHNKKLKNSVVLGYLLKFVAFIPTVKKIFGSLTYDKELPGHNFCFKYNKHKEVDFENSIIITESLD